jgi:starch phosphorylase
MSNPHQVQSQPSGGLAEESAEAIRTGLKASDIHQAIIDHLMYTLARPLALAEPHDYYQATSLAVRDRMQQRWMDTARAHYASGQKIACYLSAEFLMGPHLGNNLVNLGIEQATASALAELGQNIDVVLDCEEEPGLGNGGLGRLAACYLDSLASLQRPAIGYGIRYEFGIFGQEVHDGWQTEITDKWLHQGNPWEIAKPKISFHVNWGGHTEHFTDSQGVPRVRWIPETLVKGVAYDTPIQGYAVHTCNTLRLWSAEAVEAFDFQAFNTGDYYQAVAEKITSETVSKVLYPNDEPDVGKRLRLAQQYFFVSCSLQDMLRLLDIEGEPVERFAERFAVQLNDTHPSIGVAELMRLLIDERGLEWSHAWAITVATFGYTNHTLLPEALETWPLSMFAVLLPRHLEIIFEINCVFLAELRARFPGDEERVARMSIIAEGDERRVRMAHLATVGSHAVNGVAALHSELLKSSVLKDFYELWPERFSNKTNGVTPRRFLALSNPGLRDLLNRTLGKTWLTDMSELRRLEAHIEDADFRKEWHTIKEKNKQRLAAYVKANTGVELDPTWLFDIQVKRIHEYKRQHLNVLHIITHYLRLKANPSMLVPPRAFIFGGKAAPGYFMAKRIIKLINAVADKVNNDPDVNTRMKAAFIPNFNVKNAHLIYPAADLSEQISTAGKEASGTGNMKFMMNGALTIGTLDGANVEIREEAGAENFFLFGLSVEEVTRLKHEGYHPDEVVASNQELRTVLNAIGNGMFSHGDTEVFRPIVENLTWSDPFLVLADYAAFIACQERVDTAWQDRDRWTRMSILNTARSGKFSSDRAIAEYCDEIWGVQPVVINPWCELDVPGEAL